MLWGIYPEGFVRKEPNFTTLAIFAPLIGFIGVVAQIAFANERRDLADVLRAVYIVLLWGGLSALGTVARPVPGAVPGRCPRPV